MSNVAIKALAIAIFPCIAAAATPPPAHHDSSRGQVTTVARPIASLTMGSLGVQFEGTPLSKIRDAIKAGAIAHHGDAGDSEYWLCYTAGAGADAQRVWIIADGEMGGDDHRVTSVYAERAADAAASQDCPQLPAKFRPLKLDRRVWLGKATQAADGWATYSYAGKRGKFDLTSELAVHTIGGKVVALSAFRITSN